MFHGLKSLPFLASLLDGLLLPGGGFLRVLRGFLCRDLLGGFLRRSLHGDFLRRSLHGGLLRGSLRGGLLCRRFLGCRFLGGRFGRRGFRLRFRGHRRDWSLYRSRNRRRRWCFVLVVFIDAKVIQ